MQSYLQAVLDFTKELSEDAELDLGDIPGITPSACASFLFVEEEVRAQLAHLPESQHDEIVSRLCAFEGDVFETRTQPQPPPIRPGFDVPIVEKEGSEPRQDVRILLRLIISRSWIARSGPCLMLVLSGAAVPIIRHLCCLRPRRMASCEWLSIIACSHANCPRPFPYAYGGRSHCQDTRS